MSKPKSSGAKRFAVLRKGAPLALIMAGLIGTTVLTAPTLPGSATAAEHAVSAGLISPSGFANLVEKVKPAVISVRVRQQARFRGMSGRGDNFFSPPGERSFREFFEFFGPNFRAQPNVPRHRGSRRTSQGSGFFISKDGYAVTNNHVVDGGGEVQVVLSDGTKFDAKVIGTDAKTDLALLKVDAKRTFDFVSFADKEARVGDWVIAVGNPFGLGGTVTTGIVSARGREIGAGPYDDFLQIDAAINRGNSGGPAFNIEGKVIGVNTAIFSPSGGNVGIGFAIPASLAKQVIQDLKDDGAVTRGWLGVNIQNISAEIAESLGVKGAKGALVSEVTPGSPAARAGLMTGDAITEVNGKPVKSPRDLARRISSLAPGSDVELTIYRNGRKVSEKVTIGSLPGKTAGVGRSGGDPASVLSRLGLRLTQTRTDQGEDQIVVAQVDPDGVAAEKGIRPGDAILQVADVKVKTSDQFRAALKRARTLRRDNVLFLVRRGKSNLFVAVPVK